MNIIQKHNWMCENGDLWVSSITKRFLYWNALRTLPHHWTTLSDRYQYPTPLSPPSSSPPLPAPFPAHPFPFQPTAILDPWTPHISSLPSQTHSHNYPSLLHPTNNHAISTTLFETITLCLLMDLLTTCTAIQWTTIRTTITTPIPSRYEHYTHSMQTGYPQMLQNLRGGYKLALLDTLT